MFYSLKSNYKDFRDGFLHQPEAEPKNAAVLYQTKVGAERGDAALGAEQLIVARIWRVTTRRSEWRAEVWYKGESVMCGARSRGRAGAVAEFCHRGAESSGVLKPIRMKW